MNDHETLLTAAWEEWHFGVDPEIMPQPNASFKVGFNAGLVAAHESHCKALVRIDELQAAATNAPVTQTSRTIPKQHP